MKKKGIIIISLLICLIILGVGIAHLIMGDNEEKLAQRNFTQQVFVEKGVASPEKSELSFTLEEEGEYVLFANWMTGMPGLLTGVQILDGQGKSIAAFTAESILLESGEMELQEGEYVLEIYYLTSQDKLQEFLAMTGLEHGEEEYSFAESGTWDMNYEFYWKHAEDGISTMSLAMLLGASVGIFITIIILAITKTDDSVTSKFDERQEIVRGKGFKYGFFTIMICNGIMIMLKLLEITLFQELESAMIFSIVAGVAVFASYCIWNDGYFSLNENKKLVMITFAFVGVMNIVIGIGNLLDGRALQNGSFTLHSMNLFCGFLFVDVFVVMLLKKIKDRKEE